MAGVAHRASDHVVTGLDVGGEPEGSRVESQVDELSSAISTGRSRGFVISSYGVLALERVTGRGNPVHREGSARLAGDCGRSLSICR